MKRPSLIHRRRPFPGLSFNRMIPNILTLLALCAGLTAIRFGFEARWEDAVLAVFVAAILDGLDGRIARLLNGTSRFGAELDSLSDFVSFGVAPAMIHYLWVMRTAGGVGWVLVCLFAVCCALRLARFNTLLDSSAHQTFGGAFFMGVPAPAAAGVALLPVIVSFQESVVDVRQPEVSALFLVAVSALMVSRIPTYSFKRFKVPAPWVLPTMLIVGLLAASMVGDTWLTISALLVIYLLSIPLGVRSYLRLKRHAEGIEAEADAGAVAAPAAEIAPPDDPPSVKP